MYKPSPVQYYPLPLAAEIAGCSVERMARIADALDFPLISTDQRRERGVMVPLVPVQAVDKLKFLIDAVEDAVVQQKATA